jgi:hypothetical protein
LSAKSEEEWRRKRRVVDPLITEKERQFEKLLLACLPECARGRWGLFGQHERNHGAAFARRYYSWPQADQVVALAEEIKVLREASGDNSPFPLLERFFHLCTLEGQDVLPEPKLALQLLQQLKREEQSAPSDRAFWT